MHTSLLCFQDNWFPSVNLKCTYFEIPMYQNSLRKYLNFAFQGGSYEYLVLHIGFRINLEKVFFIFSPPPLKREELSLTLSLDRFESEADWGGDKKHPETVQPIFKGGNMYQTLPKVILANGCSLVGGGSLSREQRMEPGVLNYTHLIKFLRIFSCFNGHWTFSPFHERPSCDIYRQQCSGGLYQQMGGTSLLLHTLAD